MGIDIHRTDPNKFDIEVREHVTLPALHIALARTSSATEKVVRPTLRLDLRHCQVDATPTEVDRFVDYLDGSLLNLIETRNGHVVVEASQDLKRERASGLVRALTSLAHRSAILHVLDNSEETPGLPAAGPDDMTFSPAGA